MPLTITAIDPKGIQRGLLEPLEAQAVLRLNNVSTFAFSFDLADPLVARLGPGWCLLAQDEGVRFSGPITSLTTVIEAGARTLQVTGKDQLHALADRLIYPDGSKEAWKQTLSHYTRTQPAETLIKWLVDVNAGPGTLPVRRANGLLIEKGGGRGPTVTISERFSNLLETCQKLAALGDLAFLIDLQNDGRRIFKTRQVRDLTRQIRLEATGSLALKAPTVNDVLIAGQGEGAARKIVERTRGRQGPSYWGHRIEVFKDRRDTNEQDVLVREGETILDEGAQHLSASFELTELPGTVFGIDFLLGDRITLELAHSEFSEQVTSADITWDGHGRTVKLGVGPEGELLPVTYSKYLKLDARLRGLERNV